MSKPFYVGYGTVVADPENLEKTGGMITFYRNKNMLKFPSKEAYNEFLRLNAEKIMARKRQHA